MKRNRKRKLLFSLAAASGIVFFPAYRYYVIGMLLAHRLYSGKAPVRYRVVPKESKHFKRLVRGEDA